MVLKRRELKFYMLKHRVHTYVNKRKSPHYTIKDDKKLLSSLFLICLFVFSLIKIGRAIFTKKGGLKLEGSRGKCPKS